MNYTRELQEKIAMARRTGKHRHPPLPFSSFRHMMEHNRFRRETWLIYIDSDDRRTEISYREFLDLAVETAHFLTVHGITAGDRIATMSHNHWHTVVHYFAAWLIGAVVVPVNTGEDDERIRYILTNAGVKLVFVREDYRDRLETLMVSEPALETLQLVVCGDSAETFKSGGEFGDLPEPVDGEADALIVYTSGTTGNPKGVLLSQNNLMEDARSISEWHGITEDTRMMCVLPVHHVNGTVVTLITPFYSGGSVVLNQKFRSASFFRIIEDEKVHIASVVPTLLQFLNNEYKDRPAPAAGKFRHIICGAGPLSVNVAQQFEDKFGIRIVHGYGLSETTCYSCFLPIGLKDEDHRRWMRDFGYPSIGAALPVNDMQIHDPQGNPVGEEQRGEIVIRGFNVMKEYYGNASANENAFTFGWFRSGDEGFYRTDEDGNPYFFITGRLKELIIRGGVNLSPLEIDEIISNAPGVESGIAVGFENDWYGEEVGAYVKLLPDAAADEQSILKYCRERLPFSKSPKVVIFGDDIPITSTGKYQRLRVAPHFSRWKSRQFRDDTIF